MKPIETLVLFESTTPRWLTGGVVMKPIETILQGVNRLVPLTGGVVMKPIETLINELDLDWFVDRWCGDETN